MPIMEAAKRKDSSWNRDLLIVALTTLAGALLVAYLDAFDRLVEFVEPYEHWELDELILGTFILTISLFWFAWRRWTEARDALTQKLDIDLQLRRTNEEISFLTSAAPGILYTCEPQSDFTASFISASVERHLGYKPEAFTNDPKFWSSKLHPEDKDRVLAELNNVHERDNIVQEYRFQHEDNSFRWIHDQRTLYFDANGVPERLVGVLVDITSHKLVEDALRLSEQRFKAIFDYVPAALFLKGTDGRYKLINKRYAEWFEIEPGEIVGKNVFELYPRERAEQYEKSDQRLRATGKIDSEDVEIPLPSGDVRNFTLTKFPIWNGDQVQDIGAVMMDVTDRELALKEMRVAKEMAEEAGKTQGEFITNMNHELRTPLTSIKGSLGLVQKGLVGKIPDQLREMLEIAYRNCTRLENLIDDVLDIQKIEAGKLELTAKPLNTLYLLKTAIEANKGYGERYGIRFIAKNDCTDIAIEADEDRLMQVFANLMSNAAKFSDANSDVELSVSHTDDTVRFSVTDHGCGIPEAFREKIFERFLQLDSSDARQTGGTGLGLNIARKIVEMHDGSLDFVSEVGNGTTFFFDLPMAKIQHQSQALETIDASTNFA